MNTPTAISVVCPQCRKQLRGPLSLAGKKVKCPRCAVAIEMPVITPESDAAVRQQVQCKDGESVESDAETMQPNPKEATVQGRTAETRNDLASMPAYDRSGPRIPMPGTVITAIVIFVADMLLTIVLLAISAISLNVFGIVLFTTRVVVSALVIWGLVRGFRLAWHYGRVMSLLAICVTSFFGLIMFLNRVFGQFGLFFLLIVAGSLVPLILIVIVLGEKSARRYFKCVCPNCGSKSIVATDFWFKTFRCKKCKNRHT